ncbi:MAG: hypothetical protein WC197_04750 [Candidatus Gastranaerophilaceae bacterium]|jgi:hypothetical protein
MVRVSTKLLKYIEELKMSMKKGKIKEQNPFSKDKDNHMEHDSFIESLFKRTKKYDKSTYPNTYVWIEKFHEAKEKERKSNVIKAKKRNN